MYFSDLTLIGVGFKALFVFLRDLLWLMVLVSCDLLPASLSQTPTPHKRFVENKRRSAIRKACQKTVEAPFSRFSGTQSRIFELVVYSVFKERPPDTLRPAA